MHSCIHWEETLKPAIKICWLYLCKYRVFYTEDQKTILFVFPLANLAVYIDSGVSVWIMLSVFSNQSLVIINKHIMSMQIRSLSVSVRGQEKADVFFWVVFSAVLEWVDLSDVAFLISMSMHEPIVLKYEHHSMYCNVKNMVLLLSTVMVAKRKTWCVVSF